MISESVITVCLVILASSDLSVVQGSNYCSKFERLTLIIIKFVVFWDVALCSAADC
jgi:hypothetical protein